LTAFAHNEEGSDGLETITIEAATPELGRALYSALSEFHPELDTDADGKCIVSVRASSDAQMREISGAVRVHLVDRADSAVTSVSFSGRNDSRDVGRLKILPRPRLTLVTGGKSLQDEEGPWKSYAVQLLLFNGGTSTTGVYESPTGELPRVNDVIPVDEEGRRARVTSVSRNDHPPIRAALLS
jgi:hypothetical protein